LTGCKIRQQAGARYLSGTAFSPSSDSVNNFPKSLLHSWDMSSLTRVSPPPVFKSSLSLLPSKKRLISEVRVGRRGR